MVQGLGTIMKPILISRDGPSNARGRKAPNVKTNGQNDKTSQLFGAIETIETAPSLASSRPPIHVESCMKINQIHFSTRRNLDDVTNLN